MNVILQSLGYSLECNSESSSVRTSVGIQWVTRNVGTRKIDLDPEARDMNQILELFQGLIVASSRESRSFCHRR